MTDEWDGFGDAMKQLRQERHQQWWDDNTNELAASGVPHRVTNNGESYLFREPGKPKADFYPSTGRWRVAGKSKTFSGGAKEFLAWYAKQEQKP